MRVTLQMVAKEAGCSNTAVSLVLNGKENTLSEETQKKIWEAAEKLHYRPNQFASGLRSKRTRLLGLIIPDNGNNFFSDISKYVEMEARKRNYQIIYGNSFDEVENDIRLLHTFEDYCIDGILMVRSAGAENDQAERLKKEIEKIGVPIVLLDRPLAGAELPVFMTDNRVGGEKATEWLIENGHRKIGCYTGQSDNYSVQQRLEGYKNGLKKAGIAYQGELVYEDSYKGLRAEEALEHFLNQGATGIFAQSDRMAYGLYQAAQKRGLRIPEDISVVGFDNLEYDEYISPKLCSIRQSTEKISSDAVNFLVEEIEKDAAENRENNFQYYAPELIKRMSVKNINAAGGKE